MIEVRYKALLGNNLFQYCLGRILAEELGFSLQASAIRGFPNTQERVAGACHCEPVQRLTGYWIDLDGILADRSKRRIVLDGWFQRFEYYRPYRKTIRQWLALDPAIQIPAAKPDLVLHVRRTDYVALGWALPFSYYESAIRQALSEGGEIWIATDDRSDPFFRRFRRWRPKFLSGSALEQMALMMRSPRLVLSQSTFSWWPAFLGDAVEIVAPIPSFGIWSETGEVDRVDLIERDRFLCLPCEEPYVPTPLERRYQQWRSFRRTWILRLNRKLRLSLPVASR